MHLIPYSRDFRFDVQDSGWLYVVHPILNTHPLSDRPFTSTHVTHVTIWIFKVQHTKCIPRITIKNEE